MALSVYRRHRQQCEGNHPEDSRSSALEEGRRGWKKCQCLIHVSGTLGGKFSRKQTGKRDWSDANALVSLWEASGSWEGAPVAPAPIIESEPPPRVTLAHAMATFHSLREAESLAHATLRKYRTFTKQLTAFADFRGYVMLDQFKPADIDAFYGFATHGARTKGKRLGTIRSFFRFCVTRKWILESPVSADLKPPRGASKIKNKMPFTDNEVTAILLACDRMPEVRWKNGVRGGLWDGQDVKDFVWLSIYTGLRISDVGTFDISRLQGNEVFLHAKKNGGDVFGFLPDWLCTRLRARAKSRGTRQPFIHGDSDNIVTITEYWREKLNKAFELAGPFPERPTHHRFRHTFARLNLQNGVTIGDVAELLGDTEKTVREHYARWVPERQARLTKLLQDSFQDRFSPSIAVPLGFAGKVN
jgi:integrase